MDELHEEALDLIATLWRGDWSGHVFDGRDGARWLQTVAGGDKAEVMALIGELRSLGIEAYGWNG